MAKVEQITSEIHRATHKDAIPHKQFEKLRGRLRHACIGIPAGRGLMGPIDAALRGDRRWIPIKRNAMVKEALTDFSTLVTVLGQ